MREFLLTIAFAAALCYLITPFVKTLAMKAGAFINLRSRDTHTVVTPRWGGIGMWISMSITFLVVSHLPLVSKSIRLGYAVAPTQIIFGLFVIALSRNSS